MYGKCGSSGLARSVFDDLPRRNVVCWTAMIAAYSQNGQGKDALKLFDQMQLENIKPDKVAFIIALDACACLAAVTKGQEIHASIIDSGFESDVVMGTAIVSMYGKCGRLDDARSVFNNIQNRNEVSWNAMI
eukprot:c16895_g3_i1 orf=3-395(-)